MRKMLLKFIVIIIVFHGTDCFSQVEQKSGLLRDAVAIWNMSDDKNAVDKNNNLKIIGDVGLGIQNSNSDLTSFGDGRVANFNGGYLIAGSNKLQLSGKSMTLCIRVFNKSGDIPLLSKSNPDDKYGQILFQKDGMLKYIWQTSPAVQRVSPDWFNKQKNLPRDFLDGVLRIGVPVDMIGINRWHDIVFRFRETIIELFVDGVLVDEEWTHGNLYNFNGPFLIGAAFEKGQLISGFNGMIDHLALWKRPLTNDEIVQISGGKEHVAKRDLEILGPEQKSLQYWHPRGYNTSAGDVMCLFNNGSFHVFWLYDRRHHGSKWIMGAHQYAHVVTNNLKDWTHLPLAIPISRPWESAMGTGEHIVYNGIFNAYYTDCGSRVEFPEKPHVGSGIFRATSNDGVNYLKGEKPIVEGGDCSIFHDEVSDLFYLVKNGQNSKGERCLVYYTSPDMEIWTLQNEELLNAGGACPHLFKWNSWYYLSVGARFWRSKNVTGPWTANEPARISMLSYPKTADFTGGRKLAGGWIEDKGWGGDLVFFEMVQNADGSLGSKFIPEMIPDAGAPLTLKYSHSYTWLADHPRVNSADSLRIAFSKPGEEVTSNNINLDSKDSFKAVMLEGIPQDIKISIQVRPEQGSKYFGLCFRGTGNYDTGCELQFDPSDERVQFGIPKNGGPAENLKENVSLSGVKGLDKTFTLDIIIKGTIIDVCIDNRHTLIRRNYDNVGDRLFLFANKANVHFEGIKICPLIK